MRADRWWSNQPRVRCPWVNNHDWQSWLGLSTVGGLTESGFGVGDVVTLVQFGFLGYDLPGVVPNTQT
jgi:hypothetical protein